MHTTPDEHIRHLRPRLRTRTILFGVLLCLFAVVLLLASRQVALTKTGLPTETHPSLLGDRDDVEVMRGRLDREPYRTWERRLLAQADAIDTDVNVSEVEIAHRAKALAFAFSLSGERRYADKPFGSSYVRSVPPVAASGGSSTRSWPAPLTTRWHTI